MQINLKKLSTGELKKLIDDAGMEFAKRNDPGPMEPPEAPYYFSHGQPFAIGIDQGKLIFRARSAFYGWVTFAWSKDAADALQAMLAINIAKGVSPPGVAHPNPISKNWSMH